MDTILVVNAGSSSVKFQVHKVLDESDMNLLVKGQIDGVGTQPRLRAEAMDTTRLADCTFAADQVRDVPAAIQAVGN